MFISIINKYGKIKVCLILSFIISVFCMVSALIILSIFQGYIDFLGAFLSFSMPMTITPIILLKFSSLLLAIEGAKNKLEKKNTELKHTKQELLTSKNELQATNKTLQENEDRLKAFSEVTDEAIFFSDQGVCIEANEAASRMTGFSYDELIGKYAASAFAPESRELVKKNVISQYDKPYDVIAIKKDGLKFNAEIQGRLFRYKGKDIRVTSIKDITRRKKAEQELQKMAKLNSVGILAGGIAHDFNNILTGIYGNVSVAKMKMQSGHPGYDYLLEAEKSLNRATQLTTQLLTFSKGGTPVKKDVDLTKIIKETVNFDLSGSNVKPVFNFDDDLMNAKIDEGQIHQVFSNLTINANQATPDGGNLFISVENTIVCENEIIDLKPGKYIKIIVQDEGTGIDQKYLDKIFDPYFTTKQTGSGLGLATTYSIIQKHKGHIEIESELGRGSKFTIYLPVSKLQIAEREKIVETKILDKNQSAKILVMDDDEAIRTVSKEMLTLLGFSSEYVLNGELAVEKYKESIEIKKPFDLIIMDLTIPGGMGGKEAIMHILKINPEAKVIVSSGYSNGTIMADYQDSGFKGVIAKPYTISKLKEVLYEVLGND